MIAPQIFQGLTGESILNCLIGDVGGTNVRLQLRRISLKQSFKDSQCVKEFTYHTKDKPAFVDYIVDFVSGLLPEDAPHFSVIGIAGPITNNRTRMANTEWPSIEGNEIAEKAKIPHVTLINDFQAVAYGILNLSPNDLIPLNHSNAEPGQVITILGPGTGLGVSRLIPVRTGEKVVYQVWPCEGGHVCFSPANDLEIEYLQYLRKEQNLGQIVAEKAMAGQAVPYIYNFLKLKFPHEVGIIEKDLGPERFTPITDKFPSPQVFEYGVKNLDPLCRRSVEFFIGMLGTTIGDLVCNTLPYGGIYLFGGVVKSVAQFIIDNPQVNFLQDFVKYRPHLKEAFEKIPLFVIKEVSLGLEGAYNAAIRLMEQNDRNKGL